jgi:saccharopine dehydrogenase-like NADP-dependent oxidoreductase
MYVSGGPVHPKKIVVVGGGRAGEAILDLLNEDERYEPFVCEIDYDRLRALRAAGFVGEQVSGTDIRQMGPVLQDAACVICAAPPAVAIPLAKSALEAGCHYVDMSEDASQIEEVVTKATGGNQCFAPGCGLAPGLVPTLVDAMIREAHEAADITAYVGVLPAEKTNRLGYGNMWGIDGLMAEYTNPCQALENGSIITTPPLEALEQIAIDDESFEAFTTSGSLEDLVQHYRGEVQGLDFKTLRYPGHLDYIRFLLDDLKLSDRLYMFRNLLLNGLPRIGRDRVIIHIVDRNPAHPRHMTRVFDAVALKDGNFRSALFSVAAQHVCAVVDIIVQGLAPCQGVLHHSDLTLELLGKSRIGRALQLPD